MTRVIDFRVRLPHEFRSQTTAPDEYTTQYDKVLNVSETQFRTHADLLSDMAKTDVDHAVVHAEYEFGDPADELNEAVAKLVAADSERFSGYGTVSLEPMRIMRALKQVEKIAELGLKGISIQPSFFGIPIDDKSLYPIYAKATELGLPVALHSGVNYTVTFPIRNDHPLQIDQIACDFPELIIIACHGGWPWVTEMVAVMRKHPTVYAEFGGLAPRYVCEGSTGWEVMYRFMNTLLKDQILHGTDWPTMDMPRALKEWRAGGLREGVLDALLGANAEHLLGLGT